MSHASLAARYRPQTFAEVTGQETVKAILSRAAAEDKVAPAYLLSGTRGVGKTTIARIFAKALNCVHAPTGEPCNQCEQCRRITMGNHVDVVEIDGASNRGIDDARRLREAIAYAPMEGRYKVFIIDEAQNIKNPDTAQSRAVRSMKAPIRIAISGTPVENSLKEFWSIMEFTNKGYLGSAKTFQTRYANPIQYEQDRKAAERFKSITAPMLLRRLKTDKTIISDLPDKLEQDEYTLLTPAQAALYHQTVEESLRVISEQKEGDKDSLFKRQGLVLQMILALKEICNHPALFTKEDNWDPALSGKAERLLDLAESIQASREKALIFTQFKSMGDKLADLLESRLGERPMFLHGGCSLRERKDMVDRFQTDPKARFFILSLKAAGTGLNLTAASHVIHYDLWWNPAVESQATDRAYRIGQKNNVLVHRFITKNTFEEKINEIIQKKRSLADMTVSVGESWIGNMTDDELSKIFR